MTHGTRKDRSMAATKDRWWNRSVPNALELDSIRRGRVKYIPRFANPQMIWKWCYGKREQEMEKVIKCLLSYHTTTW